MLHDDFGILDWNIYFRKGCSYSNKANKMINDIFDK